MIELLETTRGAFKERVCQYMSLSYEVNVVTGYVSIEGLERILPYIINTQKVRILVGVEDRQYERLQEMLQGEGKSGKKRIQGKDSYELLRYKVREGELEIVLARALKGYRLIHSKGYLFSLRDNSVYSICGSNNLTVGGLEANKEWSLGTTQRGIYQEMLESFALDWRISTQRELKLGEGLYPGVLKDIGIGETVSGREYIEMVVDIEGSYIDIQRVYKNSGYKESLKEEMGILSTMEGMPLETVVKGCIGESVIMELDKKGRIKHLHKR